ncbi:MAG: DUF5063 domain-containing protein [Bacteroidales bacterium]|jgi:hypothetical protein|nr:DUF5063 domain-containing protein [Bacteroidales bacterium]
MNESDNIFSPPVIELFTVLNEYCIFIEKASDYAKHDILEYLNRVLPLMYLKGTLVPAVEVEHPEANERYVTEEQWQDIFNMLRAKFDKEDIFYFIDPGSNNFDEEWDIYSLSEDLTDIYQDSKDFVLLYSKNLHAARENAIHEIAALFKSHWGHRISRSLIHIHYILYRSYIGSDNSYFD